MMQTYGKLIFLPPNHCPIIFHTMSPLFSQMSPLFQVPWDIVPSYETSRQNTELLMHQSSQTLGTQVPGNRGDTDFFL